MNAFFPIYLCNVIQRQSVVNVIQNHIDCIVTVQCLGYRRTVTPAAVHYNNV